MLDETDYQDDFARTRDGYYFLVDLFRVELPQPPKETPDMRQKRLKAAIATVAGLCPVTLAEARLAARFVSADQQASECLRQINQLRHNPDAHAKLRAQSNSMARQADSAMRTLLRLQAARTKRDSKPENGDAAVWAEHRAAKTMEAALEPPVTQDAPVAATPEATVTEQGAPAPAVVVRSESWTAGRDFEAELRSRLPQGDAGAVFEIESQFSMA